MINSQIHCDAPGCQAEKRAANKWWVINMGSFAATFYAMPWHKAAPEEITQGKHVCSRACGQKLFELWMSKAEGL